MTKIIAIEGIDGSGKTLQMGLLVQALKARGYAVGEKSFPRYGSFFGSEIGRMLKGDGVRADQVDSRSMCLWFALDRFAEFQKDPAGQWDFLVLNRYTASNAVYQSVRAIDAGMEDNWEWVKALEHKMLGLPQPDLYLLLDVEPLCAQNNVDKKGQREYIESGKRDVYESQRDMLSRARARYLAIAEREKNFAVIPCMEQGAFLPPEAIHQKILQTLENRGFFAP